MVLPSQRSWTRAGKGRLVRYQPYTVPANFDDPASRNAWMDHHVWKSNPNRDEALRRLARTLARQGPVIREAAKFAFKAAGAATQTETETKKKSSRSGGKMQGRSAGKFKRGRRVKYKGRSYKLKANHTVHAESAGVVIPTAAIDGSCIIGHNNMPQDLILRSIAYACLRPLMLKLGVDTSNADQNQFWIPDANFVLKYVIHGATPQRTETEHIFFTIGAPTLNLAAIKDIASALEGFIRVNWVNKWEVTGIEFQPQDFHYTRIDLSFARIVLDVKSSLKMQNSTLAEALGDADDDEADNVASNPIYGKTYMGPGQAPRVGSFKFYLGANRRGCITENNPTFNEPLPGQAYKAKYVGKVRIEPGAIKTSVVTLRKSYLLNELLGDLTEENHATWAKPMGSYRIYHFEKMIEHLNTGTPPKIHVFAECDTKVSSYVKLKSKPAFTQETYTRDTLPASTS